MNIKLVMKIHSTISIDPELRDAAKENGFNLSNITEQALKLKLKLDKDKLPESDIRMKCSRCGSIVSSGYVCELLNRFFCSKCEKEFKCIPKDHEHLSIPGFGDIRANECNRWKA